MPGIPLVARETTNSVCNCSYSRSADQMCRQESRLHLSAEEEIAAEESLSVYCKPVELYNILQRRAIGNPSFLQRCLHYKIQAKHRRRIQMTVSLSGLMNDGLQTRNLFPLYILLARPVSGTATVEHSAVYRFNRACTLTSCTGVEATGGAQATFILPEINKLSAEVKSGSLAILLVSCADSSGSLGTYLTKNHKDMVSIPSNIGGYCLLGKISMDLLHLSWEKSPNLSLGERVELLSNVSMHSCFVKLSSLDEEKCISLQLPYNFDAVSTSQLVPVIISAEEVGAKDKSPYNSYSYSDDPTSSLSQIMRSGHRSYHLGHLRTSMLQEHMLPMHKKDSQLSMQFICEYIPLLFFFFLWIFIWLLWNCNNNLAAMCRLRAGNVIFNYRYYNNKLQRTEVTEDFSCPFCLLKCASFKGLKGHLSSSHDLFSFEFWVTEEYQAVNVSVKTDVWKSEIGADGDETQLQSFFFCSKPLRRRKSKSRARKAKHVHPLVLDSNMLAAINELRDKTDCIPQSVECDTYSPNANGLSSAGHSSADPECVQSVPGINLTPPAMLQFAKTRKLSVERPDPRNRALLQKRQFFHSHRAQPMAMEQVLSDRDSEDEVDDDVADLEDRRMLDDFLDVTKDEKQVMHLWNSFVRKQRVLADSHIPWACEAFSKLHGPDLVRAPDMLWSWRLFMVKLWNHGLLDAKTMNTCNEILEKCQSQDTDPGKS